VNMSGPIFADPATVRAYLVFHGPIRRSARPKT
jgi:hypothetical protein